MTWHAVHLAAQVVAIGVLLFSERLWLYWVFLGGKLLDEQLARHMPQVRVEYAADRLNGRLAGWLVDWSAPRVRACAAWDHWRRCGRQAVGGQR